MASKNKNWEKKNKKKSAQANPQTQKSVDSMQSDAASLKKSEKLSKGTDWSSKNAKSNAA